MVDGGDLSKEIVINWRPFSDTRAAFETVGQFEMKVNVEWKEVHCPVWKTYKEALYRRAGVALPCPWKMAKEKIPSKLKMGYSEPLGLVV